MCSADVPHTDGQWRTLPYLMPINPISGTLLHDGRLLIVAGSENDASNNTPGAESYRNAVWDPTGATEASIVVTNIAYDVFCSGTAELPDGRPLVVGGTNDYSFTGESRSSIFDPLKSAFLQTQAMADGRWYATATALGDGRVMTFSGLGLTGSTNNTVEIYDLRNAGAGWGTPTTAPFSPPLYPRMFLLPSSKVFFNGQGAGSTPSSWIFDPGTRTWTASAATTMDRSYGSAVLLPLLPPSYTPRVMNFGGGNPATASTETIDLSAASPSWTAGPDMSSGRIQMNATILPNGKVLAEGGSQNNESPSTPGKRADLYDPVSNTMVYAGTASYSRLYHSVALLLPDATVLSMGSNPSNRGSYEPAIEIYTPSYLFDANDQLITAGRPAITGVAPSPGPLGYNAPFSVTYTSASPISSAVLMRLGSATHAFDMGQRLVALCGPAPQPACSGSGTLPLTTPPNGSVAPPGWYMLFLLDSAGVPSKAQFVQLSSFASAPPVGAIDSPAADVTIPAGGSVSFQTSTSAASYAWIFPGGSPAAATAQVPGSVTFTTPGVYTASLTVIDAAGNSDPSPPTRTITVSPPKADFDIAVTPSAQAVVPGQSTTFTVTVTPRTGFKGTVSLGVGSESGFPNGVTSAGFSPLSIGGGSGASTLTMNTTTSASPYALSLTVTGTSGTLSHTASTTLLVDLAAPASLTATPGSGQVALSWPPSAAATDYHVKRALDSGGPYLTAGCASSNSFTDGGLTNGVTYYYVVSAEFSAGPNAGGESPDSLEASATPTPLAPPVPTGLVARPSDGQVALSWNSSVGAASYDVKRALSSGGPYTTVATPLTPIYTDSGLADGTRYYYVVSSVDAAGESANSAEVSATPQLVAAAAPTQLAAVTDGKRRGTIDLGWTQSSSPGISQNRIYRRRSGGTYPATPTATIAPAISFVDSGLQSRVTFCYVVTAVNTVGESPASNESCARTK
jgi:fibronectin type 3 domain-containing protein